MGFELDAFVGRGADLQGWKSQFPSTVVCPLSGELGLVPLTSKLSGELRKWAGEPMPKYDEYVWRWGKEASGRMTVAFVSVGEFGNQSHEEVTIWTEGREVMTRGPLKPALEYLRKKAGMDLGDRNIEVALEQHRGENAAEKWALTSLATGETAPDSGTSLDRTIGSSDTVQRWRQFGPLGVLAMLAMFASTLLGFFVTAILVLVWALHSNTPLRALGFRTPRNPAVTLLAGIALGIALKVALKSIAMPLLGAPAVNQTYHYVVGNAAALPWLIATALIGASFGEEVFFRGYLFERLGALLGTSRAAVFVTVLITSALFALAHFQDQGLPGVEQASMTGLVLGGIYAWRKEIWLPMIVHAAYDLTAILIIYMGWEESVARLVFP